jgi:hypothetical protein
MVRATLSKAWSFANPLSIKELEPNKFLFSSQKLQIDRVLNQVSWNVRGLLLILKPWNLLLTIEETSLNLSPFWVHGSKYMGYLSKT